MSCNDMRILKIFQQREHGIHEEMTLQMLLNSLSFQYTTSARFLGKGITDNVLQPPNPTSSQELHQTVNINAIN